MVCHTHLFGIIKETEEICEKNCCCLLMFGMSRTEKNQRHHMDMKICKIMTFYEMENLVNHDGETWNIYTIKACKNLATKNTWRRHGEERGEGWFSERYEKTNFSFTME